MVLWSYGPLTGRRHDSVLLAVSGLFDELVTTADDFCIYCDQAYQLRPQLISPYHCAALTLEQDASNAAMSLLRNCVEWSFGRIVQYFSFLDIKKKIQKLLLQPVAKPYKVGCLLTNCHTCYFDCFLPTVDEYLY